MRYFLLTVCGGVTLYCMRWVHNYNNRLIIDRNEKRFKQLIDDISRYNYV